MRPISNLAGEKIGMLSVVSRTPSDVSMWNCVCDCGQKRIKRASELNCAKRDKRQIRCSISCSLTKTVVKTPEYLVWGSMKSRCLNKNHPAYKNYGARGIDVCKPWILSFKTFLADMGKRPSDKHSLDRIDNSKGYFKENCRWATKKDQDNNRRSNIFLEYDGKRMTIAQWGKYLGVQRHLIYSRIKMGWPAEKALTTQPNLKHVSKNKRQL